MAVSEKKRSDVRWGVRDNADTNGNYLGYVYLCNVAERHAIPRSHISFMFYQFQRAGFLKEFSEYQEVPEDYMVQTNYPTAVLREFTAYALHRYGGRDIINNHVNITLRLDNYEYLYYFAEHDEQYRFVKQHINELDPKWVVAKNRSYILLYDKLPDILREEFKVFRFGVMSNVDEKSIDIEDLKIRVRLDFDHAHDDNCCGCYSRGYIHPIMRLEFSGAGYEVVDFRAHVKHFGYNRHKKTQWMKLLGLSDDFRKKCVDDVKDEWFKVEEKDYDTTTTRFPFKEVWVSPLSVEKTDDYGCIDGDHTIEIACTYNCRVSGSVYLKKLLKEEETSAASVITKKI